jgi:Rrf2 family protein
VVALTEASQAAVGPQATKPMKITAQEEYGIRCLLQLARRAHENQPVTVREVAASESLSFAYAEKLLRVLSLAGLAESTRGTRGGYRMTRPPEQVTMGQAIRALGGFVTQSDLCARFTGQDDCCVHTTDCGLRPVWATVNLHVERLLDSMPLSSILQGECTIASQLDKTAISLNRSLIPLQTSTPPGSTTEV